MSTERIINLPAVPEREAIQRLLRISINIGQSIDIVLLTEGETTARSFSGSQYDDLVSANPTWSPNKPAGVFRPDDIFAYMDYLEHQ